MAVQSHFRNAQGEADVRTACSAVPATAGPDAGRTGRQVRAQCAYGPQARGRTEPGAEGGLGTQVGRRPPPIRRRVGILPPVGEWRTGTGAGPPARGRRSGRTRVSGSARTRQPVPALV